jgi:hypothetical protein
VRFAPQAGPPAGLKLSATRSLSESTVPVTPIWVVIDSTGSGADVIASIAAEAAEATTDGTHIATTTARQLSSTRRS